MLRSCKYMGTVPPEKYIVNTKNTINMLRPLSSCFAMA